MLDRPTWQASAASPAWRGPRRRELGDAGESWSFTLQGPLGALPVRLPMAGQHNLRNALAAAAAATAAGVSAEAIVLGLAAAAHVRGRLQRLLTPTGAVLYDDSYNANPASVRAAIEFLASQPGRCFCGGGRVRADRRRRVR